MLDGLSLLAQAGGAQEAALGFGFPIKGVALMGVFGLGMCFSLLGAISVKLMPRISIDKAKFGWLISAFMFSCLVASLVFGVLIDSIGFKPVAIIGFVLTAACIFMLAQGKKYNLVVLACLLLGFGAMALNTAGNTLAPQVLFGGENATAATNLVNVFFGLGLFLTPFIVSFLFRKISYERAISVLGVIVLAPVILALMAKYPETGEGFALGNALALLKEPVILITALALFCYISLETSFSNWLPSYGEEIIKTAKPEENKDVVDASAQRMLSVFAIFMMVGRLLTSLLNAKSEWLAANGSWLVLIVAVISAFVIFAMTVTKKVSVGWLMAALAGLFFGPAFPTVIGVMFNNTDPSVQGSGFGIIFAVGLAGAVIIPKAIGNLAKGSTLQKGMRLLLLPAIGLIILAIIMGIVAAGAAAA